MKKASDNPLHRANAAPRCSAKAKRVLGLDLPGSCCSRSSRLARMHGARGGPPKGASHGRYSHGQFTCHAVEQRQALALLIRMARQSAFEL